MGRLGTGTSQSHAGTAIIRGDCLAPSGRVRRNVTREEPPPITKEVSVQGRERLRRALQGEYKRMSCCYDERRIFARQMY